ncbi:HAMP domain-containing protein [bacterium]|nr:MAG: HAMP domain-containing protein [bacterium]
MRRSILRKSDVTLHSSAKEQRLLLTSMTVTIVLAVTSIGFGLWISSKSVMFDGSRAPGPPGPSEPYDADAIKKAQGGRRGFTYAERTNGLNRVYTTPIFRNGKSVGAVQTAYPMDDVIRSFDNLRFILLTVVVPVGVALAAIASLFVVGRLLRPLRRLVGGADQIGNAGEGGRLDVIGHDEFADLAQTLNGMLARIDASFQAQQTALDAQRRFTADASHELKTPLAVVKANTGLLLYAGKLNEMEKESITAIDDAAGRMNRLVRDLLTLARTDDRLVDLQFEPCDLGALVAKAVGEIPGTSHRVQVRLENPETVRGIPSDLTRVFVNLIENAVKHSEATEPVVVTVRGSTVEVTDKGKGIAPEHLPYLFDRFYRADASRSSETGGTGLGLAIVRAIVDAHGGTVEAPKARWAAAPRSG